MFKAMSAQKKEAGVPEAPTAKPAVREEARGDLFDDDADTELEIPSFLRKKRAG